MRAKALLDAKLREVNDDYGIERDHVLKMEVRIIPSPLFYKWQEIHGKLGGQNKFPRVMRGTQFDEWENFVQQSLSRSKIE
jgi:hypothetical protein